jgi:purine-binding chemotaxis protein CheW
MSFEHLPEAERALLQQRAQRLNQTESFNTNPTLEVVMLTIADRCYALELRELRGVLRSTVTKLPGVNPLIAGAINVQGELVSVLELALLLGLPQPEVIDECILLVTSLHGNVGLRVPNLPELETIDATQTTSLFDHAALNETKVVVLNVESLMQHAEQTLSPEKNV